MAPITPNHIPYNVQQDLNTVLGQSCCRQHVGTDMSLFLGFGGIRFVQNPRGAAPHGEWEIGTYRSAWRLIEGQSIICGSSELVESVDEMRPILKKLDGAKCTRLGMLTPLDVRVEFDRDLCVDFFGDFGDEDEVFHMFLPHGHVVSLTNRGDWVSQCGVND